MCVLLVKGTANEVFGRLTVCKSGTAWGLIPTSPTKVLKLSVGVESEDGDADGGTWVSAQAHFGLLCRGIHHQTVWIKLCPCQGWRCKWELWLVEFIDSITLHFSSARICINSWILFYILCLIEKYCFTRGWWKYLEQVCQAVLSNFVCVQLQSLNTSFSSPWFRQISFDSADIYWTSFICVRREKAMMTYIEGCPQRASGLERKTKHFA